MEALVFKAVKVLRSFAPLFGALAATFWGMAGASAAPQAAGLVKVRFGGDAVSTRIVIELSRSTDAKLVASGDGDVVLDLARIKADGDVDGPGRGLVKAWSVDARPGAARLRLALTAPADIERRFMLAPGEGVEVYRYVIDLKSRAATAPRPAPATALPAKVQQTSVPAKIQAPPPAKVAQPFSLVSRAEASTLPASKLSPLRIRHVVVIDAGHGGHDPGAMSGATREKDLNLAAALLLKAKLEGTGRYRVVMTRDSDVFVPLENRVQIARRANADLFISLHADAGASGETRGASVYTLSDQGSQRVVRGVTGDSDWFKQVSAPGAGEAVRDILRDMTQRATRNRSAQFADMLVTRLTGRTELLTRAHRDAGYMVLLAPDVPAVLLEMGFVTNAADARFLSDADKRSRLTGAIAQAIDDYFDAGQQIAMD
jgi:N-acetylmuramoyl-L-alanine amidase